MDAPRKSSGLCPALPLIQIYLLLKFHIDTCFRFLCNAPDNKNKYKKVSKGNNSKIQQYSYCF